MLRRGEAPLARATATLHQPFCSLTIAQPRDFGAGRLPRRPAAARHGAKNAPIAARETRVRCSANAAQEATPPAPLSRGTPPGSRRICHSPALRRLQDSSAKIQGYARSQQGCARTTLEALLLRRRCRCQSFKIPTGNLFLVQACSFKQFC